MKNINQLSSILIFSAFVLSTTLCISCSKSDPVDTACVGDNYVIDVDRLLNKLTTIHPGVLPVTRNYEFAYNAYKLLEQKNHYTFDSEQNRIFDYECNNNLNTITNSDGNLNYLLEYDSDNRLVAYKTTNSSLHDYNLVYEGNTITVTGVIRSVANTTIVLKTNENGLVTKITRESGYSNFNYDTNGNIIKAYDYDDTSNIPIKDFEISYDTNPNPFYGQLASNYVERFIHFFGRSAFLGIDEFFRYDQFEFPYLKNNPVLLKYINCPECYTNLIIRTYEYDAQNYPIKMEESFVGAPAIIYEYQYN